MPFCNYLMRDYFKEEVGCISNSTSVEGLAPLNADSVSKLTHLT